MTKKEALLINIATSKLESLDGDPEIDHGTAENTLLELIESLTGIETVTTAFRRAADRVGFWYA